MQQSNMERIKLAHDLDLNKLLTEAGEDFAEGRAGSMLLFISKKGSSYKPMAIEYVQPTDEEGRQPGLWIHEGGNNGGSLDRYAVIFDSTDRSVTIVAPGVKNEVSGIRIDHKLRSTEFSGPQDEFSETILAAKRKAMAHCKKIDKQTIQKN